MDGLERVTAQWAKEKPHLDTSAMQLIGRVMRLNKHFESKIALCHKSYDLKLGEFDVLATLLRSGNDYYLTPSQLISSMMLTSGAMTNRLDKLEAKGLIIRVHNKQDRRSISVALSEAGIKLTNEVIEQHVKVQQELVSSLSETDQPVLNQLLKTWIGQFES
ncbi:MarR family winged helix-turn-helix transcriptional regulator [Psychromonas ossibalaenae]|uniref:MarR family winged helix-turn-helix transcriptional regulator n=1 Tax=Psychromonas ossibalaenae TaxID=444922 RepID=UPI0003688BF4|nr:MarR family transcriptional regulator [Psychromonas ossibalaenae]